MQIALQAYLMLKMCAVSVHHPDTAGRYKLPNLRYNKLLRSQSANAAHSQRSIVPVRQHR